MLAGAMWAIANIFGMNLGLLYNDASPETHTRFEQVCHQNCQTRASIQKFFLLKSMQPICSLSYTPKLSCHSFPAWQDNGLTCLQDTY